MKKITRVMIAVCLCAAVLAGCGLGGRTAPALTPTAEPTPAPTPVPTPTPTPEPETVPAVVRAIRAPAVIGTLDRGEEVSVAGEPEGIPGYLIVEHKGSFGMIKRDVLRLASDDPFEPFTGYAGYSAKLYSDIYLSSSEPVSVDVNTAVNVIDEFENCWLVEYDGRTYYAGRDQISETEFHSYYGGGGGYSGGGGGGGGGGGSADGGDISLSFRMDRAPQLMLLSYEVSQEGNTSGIATVKADGTELILAFYDYDETVRVLSHDENEAQLYISGMTATVPSCFLRFEGEERMEPWTGYAASEQGLFGDHRMCGAPAVTVPTNTELQVIENLGDCLIVVYEDSMYYAAADGVSEDMIVYHYYGGGGGGGGGGGAEWTEPAL